MAEGAVRVRGLRELERDFRKVSRELGKELRAELRRLGDPVRAEAERRATGEGWGSRWSRMKVGYARSIVYVAPGARRGRGTARPNFGRLLMTRALLPAAEHKRPEIERGIEDMLDRLLDRNDL